MASDAEFLALSLRLRALEERVLLLESRPVPAWLHTPKRNADQLIVEIISEPLLDEPLPSEQDLT